MSTLLIRNVKANIDFNQNVYDNGLNTVSKSFDIEVTINFASNGDFSKLEKLSESQRKLFIADLIYQKCNNIPL